MSRDQEDIAGIYKRLSFAGVQILTLSEGEISHLHIGLKGTMNALFLKDLADKTRRGLRGRVEAGKSGGGKCYGYDVVKKFDANGEAVKGERNINSAQAAIVTEIFEAYAHGQSPKAIAADLNTRGIKGPTGKGWSQSTINGNRERGTGILNNELYIGRLVWNRLRYIKDPDTGKRVSRLNSESDWIIQDVPDLAIIDQELWQAVKSRQKGLTFKKQSKQDGDKLWDRRRPKYLFSGLMTCGECGGGFSKISKDHFGCSTARNKGTCSNRRSIRRDVLEETVLNGLQHHLMDPELAALFAEEYTAHMNKLRIDRNTSLEAWKAEWERADKELDKLVLGLVPAHHLLMSPYPISRIWEANQPARDGKLAFSDADRNERVFVVRPGVDVHVLRVSPGAFGLLCAIQGGMSLGRALIAAFEEEPDCDPQQVFAQLLTAGSFILPEDARILLPAHASGNV